jgi:hypothetical protein
MSALATALAAFADKMPSKITLEGSAVVDDEDDEASSATASSQGMWLHFLFQFLFLTSSFL